MWLNKQFLSKRGIFSVCSSNEYVIRASIEFAKEKNEYLLLEATCHQVNQFGGYTGFTPEKYVEYIKDLIKKYNFPEDKLLLGGDHLGPDPWKEMPASLAMENAEELVKSFVKAGFRKIHLDCSMPLGNDTKKLNVLTIAKREARLYEIAEKYSQSTKLVYVVGTEVPAAGGGEEVTDVTTLDELRDSLESLEKVFQNFPGALEKIITMVVRLGISFNNYEVDDYNSDKTKDILNYIKNKRLFIEAHSTDYQSKKALKEMVSDGIRILKVGPALTSAFRRAVFFLTFIEDEIIEKDKKSNLIKKIVTVMKKMPKYWKKYYTDSNKSIEIMLKYSLLDRIRYYWNEPEIKDSLNILLRNLENNIPDELLYQFFPEQFELIRLGILKNTPEEIIKYEIKKELQKYYEAIIESSDKQKS
ncbi:MAG: D-tagatose,6-bisphosphate aldolase subunit GatZ/KbaZ [Thermosipho sp. (in: thermotogales)]|nr:D-tagatose,6-bisphosphate aldolase subunit GatZ/KbaZ [Thermosipho sp. (in: thermotogales)]